MTTVNAPAPLLSVVIPTYRRPHLLQQCLEALTRQQLPSSAFEVVVVDDGSERPPRDVVAQFAGRLQLRLIEQQNAGPAAARNAGAHAARATHVVFTDDDCLPDPAWLTAIAARIASDPDAAIGGRIVNALPDRLCSTASQLLIDFLYRWHNASPVASQFVVTANVAVSRRAFIELGGFDESFPLAAAEDRDFCERWIAARHRMLYCAEAVVHHGHALGFASFCRQHCNYGRGAHHLHVARTGRGVRGFRLESLRFYGTLILAPYHGTRARSAPLLSALLILSQAAYAYGYATERWSSRARTRPRTSSATPPMARNVQS
ncbi:MAG TPA: glycosyltransferase [Gemmatimonadaceae bacterium]|nr:glycosyltransferase [Gemmatimonadaceae bacterium]